MHEPSPPGIPAGPVASEPFCLGDLLSPQALASSEFVALTEWFDDQLAILDRHFARFKTPLSTKEERA